MRVGDIVVLLPGIGGSELQRDGKDVFAFSAQAGLSALLSRGTSIERLALPDGANDTDDLGDGVRATRLLEATAIPGLSKFDGYRGVSALYRKRLGLTPGVDFVEFPYDWRRDNRVAARRLKDTADRLLHARRKEAPEARLVLVAHSMGGLVSRYYLEVLGGWRDTRELITFGTPFRGALDALDTLANGMDKALGLVRLGDLLRSFDSVYQLLPIYPCLAADGKAPQRLTECLPALPRTVDADRVLRARQFHREIEDAVARHAAQADYRESGYRTRQVVGVDQPTGQSAEIVGGRVRVLKSHLGADRGGDGTVPRVSASPQEVTDDTDSGLFCSARHSSLQNASAVLDQLRGWATRVDLSEYLDEAAAHLSLDVADVYRQDEPVSLAVSTSRPALDLRVELRPAEGSDGPVAVTTARTGERDEWARIELSPQRPGAYRLSVSGDETDTLSDLLVVLEPESHRA